MPTPDGLGIGTLSSGTLGDPRLGGDAVAFWGVAADSFSTAISAADVFGGIFATSMQRMPPASAMYDKATPVGAVGSNLLRNLPVVYLARTDRSWPGGPILYDVQGHSHHALASSDYGWVGAGRAWLRGNQEELVTADSADNSYASPILLAKLAASYSTDTITVISKWDGTAAGSSYKLEIVDGALKFSWSDGSVTNDYTSPQLLTRNVGDYDEVILGVEYRVRSSDVLIRFAISPDDGRTLNPFGDDLILPSATPIHDSGAEVVVGSSTEFCEVYRVLVVSALNGLILLDLDPAYVPTGADRWVSKETGEEWALRRPAHPTPLPALDNVYDQTSWALEFEDNSLATVGYVDLDATDGGTVALTLDITEVEPADTVTIIDNVMASSIFRISHRSQGDIEVVLGNNVLRAPAVLGEVTVLVTFDKDGVEGWLNDEPMGAVVPSVRVPRALRISPGRIGTGEGFFRLLGVTVIRQRIDVEHVSVIRQVLEIGPARPKITWGSLSGTWESYEWTWATFGES